MKPEEIFNQVIGMTIEGAKQFVESISYSDNTHYIMRIVKEDGISRSIKLDFRFYRLNVEVIDGKISKIDSIG